MGRRGGSTGRCAHRVMLLLMSCVCTHKFYTYTPHVYSSTGNRQGASEKRQTRDFRHKQQRKISERGSFCNVTCTQAVLQLPRSVQSTSRLTCSDLFTNHAYTHTYVSISTCTHTGQVAAKINSFGFNVTPEEVVTSGWAAAQYLATRKPPVHIYMYVYMCMYMYMCVRIQSLHIGMCTWLREASCKAPVCEACRQMKVSGLRM